MSSALRYKGTRAARTVVKVGLRKRETLPVRSMTYRTRTGQLAESRCLE
jgi:hypothetical protein